MQVETYPSLVLKTASGDPEELPKTIPFLNKFRLEDMSDFVGRHALETDHAKEEKVIEAKKHATTN